MEDESYWYSSETTGFSFNDDEEISSVSSLFDSTRTEVSRRVDERSSITGQASFDKFKEIHHEVKPLESLLSKRTLSLSSVLVCKRIPNIYQRIFSVLDEAPRKVVKDSPDKLLSQWEAPPPYLTVQAIILDKPYFLHLYRSYEAKNQLLSEAVKFGDGNAILAIVLFLQNTLKRKLFSRLLQQFQSSVLPVYMNFLSTRFETRTVVEILQILGLSRDAAMKDFMFAIQPQQNIDKRLQRLRALLRDHYSMPDIEDKLFVDNFMKYVDWQVSSANKEAPLLGTVVSSLTYLNHHHWDDVKGQPLSPHTLTSLLGVSERISHWNAITARAASRGWDDISSLVLTKSWLGGKKLKTVISAERIVTELHRQQAPEGVITEYFVLIDTYEKQLELARKLAWHRGVIDTLVNMRDRQALVQYQAALNPQSEGYLHAEIALRSVAKWKN